MPVDVCRPTHLLRKFFAALVALTLVVGGLFAEDIKGVFKKFEDGKVTIDVVDSKTWKVVAPLPAGFTTNRVGPNFAWDAKADIFYASTMTKPAFKFERGK